MHLYTINSVNSERVHAVLNSYHDTKSEYVYVHKHEHNIFNKKGQIEKNDSEEGERFHLIT